MKHLLATSITLTAVLNNVRSREFLTIVPRFENLEDFYQRVRAQNRTDTSSASHEEETLAIIESKKRICLHISESVAFAETGSTSVNMDKMRVHFELELAHREMFKDISKVSSSSSPSWLHLSLYTNPYKSFEVILSTGEIVKEDVYVCLIRSRLRKWIKEFFISTEYNVNPSSNYLHEYVAGRFLFRKSNSNQMMLIWLAEEPARISEVPQNKVEHIYQERRENKQPGKLQRLLEKTYVSSIVSWGSEIICSQTVLSMFTESS